MANRLQEFFFPERAFFVLYVLQFSTEPMQGFLNAIAYVWNEPEYLEQYKILFSRCTTTKVKIIQVQGEQERLMSLISYDTLP